jgi:hypothetical protein
MIVAKGEGGLGYASNPDPDKAVAQALQGCREGARNCQVMQAVWDGGVYWAAVAMSEVNSYVRVNASSREDAEADALAGCRKASPNPAACEVKPNMTSNAQSHYARASSATRVGIGRAATVERAKSLALESCAENTPAADRCTVERVDLNDTAAPAPKKMARLKALAERNLAAAVAESQPAPRAQPTVVSTRSNNVLRCTNQCFNGSCIRTFEGGRQERWQAPRKFDPFTGNWGWDTTTNACGM